MNRLMETPYAVAQRIWQLVPEGQWLYAILDAARDPAIVEKLCTLRPEFDSLYRGRAEQTLWEVAPYLVRLEEDSEFCQWLFAEGWGKSWGIFARSAADLTRLHRNFRRFLMVKGPQGDSLYFRYYDPRVLRDYLPTCNAQEMATIFGPVAEYLAEADDPSLIMRFKAGPRGVLVESLGPDDVPGTAVDAGPKTADRGLTRAASRMPEPFIHSGGETIQTSSSTVLDTRTSRILRVTLAIEAGPAPARKTWLRPGQNVSVGRADQADFVIPQDLHMSGAHFALECDLKTCRLRDLGSPAGTSLNGLNVTEAVLKDGDEIVASHTTFVVHIENDATASSRTTGAASAAPPAAAVAAAPARVRATGDPSPAGEQPSVPPVLASIEVTAGPYDGQTTELQPG